MNTIISNRNNQAFSQTYINLVYSLGGALPESYVPQHISQRRYTPKRIKIIRMILNHINNNETTYLSHIRIAQACRLSRRAVIDAFKDFEEDGLFEIDHRALDHNMNIYKLGEFFKTREIIYALKNVFRNLYRAFCRTLERAYNAVVERNIARNLKTHFTLSFDNTERVVFGTNTNTTLSYTRKIYNKVSSLFVKESKLIDQVSEIKRREMEEKQQWLRSADGKSWTNKRKHEHASWGLNEQEKAVVKKEAAPSLNAGKISPDIMNERERMCAHEPNLYKRLAMLTRLREQVQRQSILFIDTLIVKTKKKIAIQEGHND